MAAPKTLRKPEQPRSRSASGCLSSSRDILSKHNHHVRSQPSSQMLGSPDCSQYLEDYRSYLEHKDRDNETADVETGSNKPKNAAEKPSKLQGNCGKFRSPSGTNDNQAQKLPSSPLPSQDSTVRHNSIGGSITGQSQRPLAKNAPRSRTGSLRSLSRHRSRQLDDASSERTFRPTSTTNLLSTEGRSTQRLPSFGIASVELKNERNDKVLKRKSEEAAVQTDPELVVNDVQNRCAQTDDVTDDLSYSESDVSIGGYKDIKSDKDDARNDVRSDTEEEEEEEDYREYEHFLHDEDKNKSETDGLTFSYSDLTSSHHDRLHQRDCPNPSGKATNCEFDSGLGNTASQDLSSFWEGINKSGLHKSAGVAAGNDGRRRKPQQRVRQSLSLLEIGGIQLQDAVAVGQQTMDSQSTQTPLTLPIGLKRAQVKVLGALSLGDWLLMDSGQEGGVCLAPWTMLGMTEEGKKKDEGKIVKDFATQTFEQVTDVVQVSCETQTNNEEWHKYDQSPYLEEDNDLESDLCHRHYHTSRPLEDRSENDAEVRKDVREDGEEDGEDGSSHSRTYNDHWDDDLTNEIIKVFKDTRRLIAKAKAGKQAETELPSGKRHLLEMMLKEVKNLKDIVGREGGGAGDVRVSGKFGRRKKPTKQVDSDSAIESSEEGDEDEERLRRTELLFRNPHDRHDRVRRKNRDRRHSEQSRSIGRGQRSGRHHSRLEPDSRYKHWITRPNRTEYMPERHPGLLQNALPAPPMSQELPPQYQRNLSSSHDPRTWSRPVQRPPQVQYQSASLWNSQRPSDSVALNLYPGQFPHSSVGPVSLAVPAAPSIYWRHPTPLSTLLSTNQHLPNANPTSLWSGAGKLGLGGAFRPTQAASTLQKPNVVFYPGTLAGIVHPGFSGQGYPSVLLSQQGPVSYIPIQSVPPNQPSEVLLAQGRPVAVRPVQGQGLPVGPAQRVTTKPFSTPQNPPQTSVQRRRVGPSRRWKESEFEFERSIKHASLEAEQIKELSNRLLRQSGQQTSV